MHFRNKIHSIHLKSLQRGGQKIEMGKTSREQKHKTFHADVLGFHLEWLLFASQYLYAFFRFCELDPILTQGYFMHSTCGGATDALLLQCLKKWNGTKDRKQRPHFRTQGFFCRCIKSFLKCVQTLVWFLGTYQYYLDLRKDQVKVPQNLFKSGKRHSVTNQDVALLGTTSTSLSQDVT